MLDDAESIKPCRFSDSGFIIVPFSLNSSMFKDQLSMLVLLYQLSPSIPYGIIELSKYPKWIDEINESWSQGFS